jgi:hypothetical protein
MVLGIVLDLFHAKEEEIKLAFEIKLSQNYSIWVKFDTF